MHKPKLSLQQRLLACCCGLAMVALLGSGVAYWTTNRMGEELERIANDAGQKLDAVGEFSTLLDRIRISGRQVLVYGYFKKPEIVTQEIQKIEDAKPRLDSAMLRLKGLLKSSEESQIFAKAEEVMAPWYQNIVAVNQLCLAGKPEEAAASSQKNGRAVSQIFDQTTSLAPHNRAERSPDGYRRSPEGTRLVAFDCDPQYVPDSGREHSCFCSHTPNRRPHIAGGGRDLARRPRHSYRRCSTVLRESIPGGKRHRTSRLDRGDICFRR